MARISYRLSNNTLTSHHYNKSATCCYVEFHWAREPIFHRELPCAMILTPKVKALAPLSLEPHWTTKHVMKKIETWSQQAISHAGDRHVVLLADHKLGVRLLAVVVQRGNMAGERELVNLACMTSHTQGAMSHEWYHSMTSLNIILWHHWISSYDITEYHLMTSLNIILWHHQTTSECHNQRRTDAT